MLDVIFIVLIVVLAGQDNYSTQADVKYAEAEKYVSEVNAEMEEIDAENSVLKEQMREMTAAGGAIFFSTHVLDVAEKLCNKVAIIKDGQLITSGLMDEVVKEGASLEELFMETV